MTNRPSYSDAYAEICRREGPLRERLQSLTELVKTYDNRFSDAYEDLVRQVSTTVPGPRTPDVGELLPHFLLPDQNTRLVDLDRLLERGPLVLSFNRGHWCEYCEMELRAFARAHTEFAAFGASAVSIMPEKIEFTKQMSLLCDHAFPILSDMDNAYALALDLVMWLGDDLSRLYRSVGIDIEQFQGNGMWFVPVPATFVVEQNGRIAWRHVDPDFRRRAETDEILAVLQSLAGS
ncbi:MAG: peroxiredoxin-like family protein [Hyphomicrobium sp.]|nr:peroxiredoxin-like family protein [Hyphomicrobium sp.]